MWTPLYFPYRILMTNQLCFANSTNTRLERASYRPTNLNHPTIPNFDGPVNSCASQHKRSIFIPVKRKNFGSRSRYRESCCCNLMGLVYAFEVGAYELPEIRISSILSIPSVEHVARTSGWCGENKAWYTHAACAWIVVIECGRSGVHYLPVSCCVFNIGEHH